METDKNFLGYDKLVHATLVNIYSLSKEKEAIFLKNLNLKNKDHLFVLNVALAARNIFGFPLYIEGGFWKELVINLKIGRKQEKITVTHKIGKNHIDIPTLLLYEKAICKTEGITYKEVYEAYYERRPKRGKRRLLNLY